MLNVYVRSTLQYCGRVHQLPIKIGVRTGRTDHPTLKDRRMIPFHTYVLSKQTIDAGVCLFDLSGLPTPLDDDVLGFRSIVTHLSLGCPAWAFWERIYALTNPISCLNNWANALKQRHPRRECKSRPTTRDH